ncbi:MAG: mucin-binding protein [Limosilactobacillus pontis]
MLTINQHYQLVSDTSNGQPLVFDNDDTVDQHYEVHFKHGLQKGIPDRTTKNLIVHYVFEDGSQAHPDKSPVAVAFNRTGTKDLVTGNTTWGPWSPQQTFATVSSPNISGYTPNPGAVSGITIKGDGPETTERTVKYTANDQQAVVEYIDDTTNTQLDSTPANGKFGTKISFNPSVDQTIQKYKGQHYVLVSNGFKNQYYQSDNSKNIFKVHFKHATTPVTDKTQLQKEITEVIHYVYADGKKAADDYSAQPLTFTRTGTKDLVNNQITWTPWTPATQSFPEEVSPVIDGYTPDRQTYPAVSVNASSNNVVDKVIYIANDQKAQIKYIDDHRTTIR